MPTRFYKMTGSGNDFIVFDSGSGSFTGLERPEKIRSMCARGTGIGADGAVFLEVSGTNSLKMRYYNADGSRASLCGNASLCSTRLAVELGVVSREFILETDAGRLPARMKDGLPEIDLEPVSSVEPEPAALAKEPGEMRLGFAVVGVPHVVVNVPDLERIELDRRGAELRRHPTLPAGANVNFVAGQGDSWAYRTFERGVEGETLACGTGAVATAILLSAWGETEEETTLQTRSGEPLVVRLTRAGDSWQPSLRGEGRIVYEGSIRELD